MDNQNKIDYLLDEPFWKEILIVYKQNEKSNLTPEQRGIEVITEVIRVRYNGPKDPFVSETYFLNPEDNLSILRDGLIFFIKMDLISFSAQQKLMVAKDKNQIVIDQFCLDIKKVRNIHTIYLLYKEIHKKSERNLHPAQLVVLLKESVATLGLIWHTPHLKKTEGN